MKSNVQFEESSPTEMINNNFPVRPVYDREMTQEERQLHEKEKRANFDSRCKFCVGGRGRRRFHRQRGFKFVSLEDKQQDQHQDHQDHPEVPRDGV